MGESGGDQLGPTDWSNDGGRVCPDTMVPQA